MRLINKILLYFVYECWYRNMEMLRCYTVYIMSSKIESKVLKSDIVFIQKKLKFILNPNITK